MLESELTETASEGEGEYDETGRENFVSTYRKSDLNLTFLHFYKKNHNLMKMKSLEPKQ